MKNKLKLQVEMQKIGFRITTYSEDLGYTEAFTTVDKLKDKISELKNQAKKIDSDREFDTLYIYAIYETNNKLIESAINTLDVENLKSLNFSKDKFYYEIKEKEIKVKLSDKSIKYAQIFKSKNKIKSKKINCCVPNNDMPKKLFKIKGNYYVLSYQTLYKVPEDLKSFVKNIFKKKKKIKNNNILDGKEKNDVDGKSGESGSDLYNKYNEFN